MNDGLLRLRLTVQILRQGAAYRNRRGAALQLIHPCVIGLPKEHRYALVKTQVVDALGVALMPSALGLGHLRAQPVSRCVSPVDDGVDPVERKLRWLRWTAHAAHSSAGTSA